MINNACYDAKHFPNGPICGDAAKNPSVLQTKLRLDLELQDVVFGGQPVMNFWSIWLTLPVCWVDRKIDIDHVHDVKLVQSKSDTKGSLVFIRIGDFSDSPKLCVALSVVIVSPKGCKTFKFRVEDRGDSREIVLDDAFIKVDFRSPHRKVGSYTFGSGDCVRSSMASLVKNVSQIANDPVGHALQSIEGLWRGLGVGGIKDVGACESIKIFDHDGFVFVDKGDVGRVKINNFGFCPI